MRTARPRLEPLEDRRTPALFGGGVFVAVGDVNHDGAPDLITGAGPGGGPEVQVISGKDGSLLQSFYAYSPSFAGGVEVAAADVNGDGYADIITGAGPGGGPHVEVFSGKDGSLLKSFYAFAPTFAGGVHVAAGDVTGDGHADIITGEGAGGASLVNVFDGVSGSLVRSLAPYPTGFTGGATVAAGDLDGDGRADIVTGAGPGGGPNVEAFSGATGAMLTSFMAFDTSVTTGVTVAAGDLDGDGKAEILVGEGPGGEPRVRAFNTAGVVQRDFLAYAPGFVGGVHVAAGDVSGDGHADIITGAGPGGGPHVRILDGTNEQSLMERFAFDPTASAVGFVGSPSDTPPTPAGTFPADLSGWAVREAGGTAGARGTVTVQNGQAILTEGNSSAVALATRFTAVGSGNLIVNLAGVGFANSGDGLQMALLDDSGQSVVPTTSDGLSFLRFGGDGSRETGTGTTVTGSTVVVDLSAVPAGTSSSLVIWLANGDGAPGSSAVINSVTLPGPEVAPPATKFYVADPGADALVRYSAGATSAGSLPLAAGSNPRGVAANAAGDTIWTVDGTSHRVTIFGPDGSQRGSWLATDAIDPEGVTVSGNDLWLVDRGRLQVLFYAGGAIARGGAQAATSAFALDAANAHPSDLVTDGNTIWVTDDGADAVFVYDRAGTLQGSWQLDPANLAPSGITLNPNGGTDLWVVDRQSHQVFDYAGGTQFTNGAQTATDIFRLTAHNSSPEGIADPPAGATFAAHAQAIDLTLPNGTVAVGRTFAVGSPGTGDFGPGWKLTSSGPDSASIVLHRDRLGRIMEAVGPDGRSVTYDYDALGRLAQVMDRHEAVTRYHYGPGGIAVLEEGAE